MNHMSAQVIMLIKPTAILIHVPDVQAGLAWYQQAFPQAKAEYLPEFDFTLTACRRLHDRSGASG